MQNKQNNITAIDYKGKWFILQDVGMEDDFDYVRPDVDVSWASGEGLAQHVANCVYYGIPAYCGSDEELHRKIKEIQDKL